MNLIRKTRFCKPAIVCFVSLLALMNTGCEDFVSFSGPQPGNTKEHYRFPERFAGTYTSTDDSSTLVVNTKAMIRILDYKWCTHPSSLDSIFQIKNDTIRNMKTGECFPFEKSGDSLLIHVHLEDTLFAFTGKNHIRKLKGFYFLNIQYTDSIWGVHKVYLQKGQLHINRMSSQQDLEILGEIVEMPADSVSRPVSLSKRQFRKFIQNNGFSEGEVFVKTRGL